MNALIDTETMNAISFFYSVLIGLNKKRDMENIFMRYGKYISNLKFAYIVICDVTSEPNDAETMTIEEPMDAITFLLFFWGPNWTSNSGDMVFFPKVKFAYCNL